MSNNKAIEVNSLNTRPFPITIDFSVKENYYRVFLTPMSVMKSLDLIPHEMFLIFNVSAYEFDDSGAISLSEIAGKYSAFIKKFDEETLLIEKQQIIKLLDEMPHYDFCLIDAARDIEIDKVIQIIDLADKLNELTVIKETDSNFLLSSHDDCYFYFETNDRNVALELIALQIKILVAKFSDQPTNKLNFNPTKLVGRDEFSIVIPQDPIEHDDKVVWKIFEGTFRNFVYREEMNESDVDLVYLKSDNEIKVEKV